MGNSGYREEFLMRRDLNRIEKVCFKGYLENRRCLKNENNGT